MLKRLHLLTRTATQARKVGAVHAANKRELQSYEDKQRQLEDDIAQVGGLARHLNGTGQKHHHHWHVLGYCSIAARQTCLMCAAGLAQAHRRTTHALTLHTSSLMPTRGNHLVGSWGHNGRGLNDQTIHSSLTHPGLLHMLALLLP